MKSYKEVVEATLKEKEGNWGKPVASYKLTYNSKENQLEPIYYWILDFIKDAGWKTEKITDNFAASPGSGQYEVFSNRAIRMQDEGMKISGAINQVIKSILNLIYDLREFEQRLATYDDANNTKEPAKRLSGLLGLKQIWLDNVDIKRNRGSIHSMANEGGFSTLREAFMLANNQEDLKRMNKNREGTIDKDEGWINDSVYRILVPRLEDFFKWKEYSEQELRKRMQIEKNYLKSQVETLKLYSSWMKPYIKAAQELQQQGFDSDAALVHAFSTSMFELTLLGKKEVGVPAKFDDKYGVEEKTKLKRKYYQVILITMKYRGHVSQRVTQKGDMGFVAGGRLDMTFDAYALNEQELKLIETARKKDDLSDMYTFSFDTAGEALETLRKDLDHFIYDDKEKKQEEKKKEEQKTNDDTNPFSALIDFFKDLFTITKKKEEKKDIKTITDIPEDDFIEKSVRATAAKEAGEGIFVVYDIYKKAHGHASSPTNFDNADEGKTSEPGPEFKDLFTKR